MVNLGNIKVDGDNKCNDNFTITPKCLTSNNKDVYRNHTHFTNNHLCNTWKANNLKIHQNIWGMSHKIDEFFNFIITYHSSCPLFDQTPPMNSANK